MDLATVTPSLVIFGAPYGCAMMTLRPFGPRVTYGKLKIKNSKANDEYSMSKCLCNKRKKNIKEPL